MEKGLSLAAERKASGNVPATATEELYTSKLSHRPALPPVPSKHGTHSSGPQGPSSANFPPFARQSAETRGALGPAGRRSGGRAEDRTQRWQAPGPRGSHCFGQKPGKPSHPRPPPPQALDGTSALPCCSAEIKTDDSSTRGACSTQSSFTAAVGMETPSQSSVYHMISGWPSLRWRIDVTGDTPHPDIKSCDVAMTTAR
ncbi:hypothetical protein SKAU_G00242410 [Synaphobranchus kaupii]|uniref:Uncharacterized protein n=1 Tax=Synaphobranchus kaupii TaxID=118154 RepID=A0A9Q1ITH0_SYNKA|nr:hypothetical protein SKAU_G00242410 [Synaphobranchus kaupii]